MNKKIVIIAISIIVGISILFFTGKIILNKYNEKQFNEKYKDYVFYDVEWYDESTNGTNVYEDISIKRIELLEQYSMDENLTELKLDDFGINKTLKIKIKDGKLIYKYDAYEYESTNITNAKEILKFNVFPFGDKIINIIILTTDGDIYYSGDISKICYFPTETEFKNFDLTYKKVEANIKYDNIKKFYSKYQLDSSDILVAESSGKKVFYDNKYNEYIYGNNQDYFLVGGASESWLSVNFDGTINENFNINENKEVFTNLDKKIYFQKIYTIGDSSPSTTIYNPMYIMIDRQGYLYRVKYDDKNTKIELLNTNIKRIKKVGYKVESGILKSIVFVEKNNDVSQYEIDYSEFNYSYENVFDSSLQLEKLLLNKNEINDNKIMSVTNQIQELSSHVTPRIYLNYLKNKNSVTINDITSEDLIALAIENMDGIIETTKMSNYCISDYSWYWYNDNSDPYVKSYTYDLNKIKNKLVELYEYKNVDSIEFIDSIKYSIDKKYYVLENNKYIQCNAQVGTGEYLDIKINEVNQDKNNIYIIKELKFSEYGYPPNETIKTVKETFTKNSNGQYIWNGSTVITK